VQPLPVLLGRGKQVQQLHVAGVRRAAVEHLRGPGQAPQDLGQRRIGQVTQRQPGLIVTQAWQKETPQPFRAGQRLEIGHERRRKHPVRHRLMPRRIERQNIAIKEIFQALAQCPHLRWVFKIHGVLPGVDSSIITMQ
jgi:hypothetical protein